MKGMLFMKADKALKKAGINVVKELSILEINKIASNISEKICSSFPEHNINKTDLFIALSRVNMYLADFQDNSAAKYYYKNNSIYFKKDIDFNSIETPALHECLHFIQTVRTKNGKIKRLGLYDLSKIVGSGLALNEAAVQLMASGATNVKPDSVKYYGMEFKSDSPNYYPIECALVKQMTYFTGTYPLYHSTLYSDDIFKNTFIMKSSTKTYNKILNNLDLIVDYQETLHKESLYLSYIEYNNINSSKIQASKKAIENIKSEIKNLTLRTQELILTSCAYSDLELVRDEKSVKEFKNKLYKFQKYLIITEGDNFFNDFYCHMMEELDIKRELIKKYGVFIQFKDIRENLSLIETRQETLNLFQIAIDKLKKLFKINQEDYSYYKNNSK
jgi:hypothetical protein